MGREVLEFLAGRKRPGYRFSRGELYLNAELEVAEFTPPQVHLYGGQQQRAR